MDERRIPTPEEIKRGIDRDADRFATVFAALAGDEQAIKEMEEESNGTSDQ